MYIGVFDMFIQRSVSFSFYVFNAMPWNLNVKIMIKEQYGGFFADYLLDHIAYT